MARQLNSRCQLPRPPRGRIAAIALLVLAVAIPATAQAQPAAIDEYSLDSVGDAEPPRADAQRPVGAKRIAAADSLGVVGESSAGASSLEVAGSSPSTALWVLAAVLVLAGGLVLARTPREDGEH